LVRRPTEIDPTEAHQRRAQAIHDGQMALHLHNYLQPALQGQRLKIVERAIAEYRGGTLTPQASFGYFAEMVGLDDLRADLETEVRRGFTARAQEEKNGTGR
jgi:hypothetical protein